MDGAETWEDFEKLLESRGIMYRDIGTKTHDAFNLHKRLTGPIQSKFSIKLPANLTKRKRKGGNKDISEEKNEESLTQLPETESDVDHSDIVLSQTTDLVLSSTQLDQNMKSVGQTDSVKRPRLSPIVSLTEKKIPQMDAPSTDLADDSNNNHEQESIIQQNGFYEDITRDSESLVVTMSQETPLDKQSVNHATSLRETVSKARIYLEKHSKTCKNKKVERREVRATSSKPFQSSTSKSNSYSLLCQIANHLAQWRHNLEEANKH